MKSSLPGIPIIFEGEAFDPVPTIWVEDYPPYRNTPGLSPVTEVRPVETLTLLLPRVCSACGSRS